jgi:DNA-binding response OmpR family regulator/anti-sigma regulatory factor (Ser/Thr protein kinase)
LVNEILDLTKLESATLQVELSKISVVGFVSRIVAEFEAFAKCQGLTLRFEHDLGVLQTAWLDVTKVETILYNFISNAIKFTQQGGQIQLKIYAKNKDLQLEIQDTGCGIHEQDLPYIFNRFYQSKVKNMAKDGTGLGLALSKELVNLLRGDIWVTSEWGKGSCFHLLLPNCLLAETLETDNIDNNIIKIEHNISKENIASENDLLQKNLFTILLVEDNLDLQHYITDILSRNYNVVKKNNGEEALNYLNAIEEETQLPNLIISDIMMPIIDGYQLSTILKQAIKYQNIPIIVLTARVGLEDKLKALRIGVDDYLTKPFIEAELLARISNLLENYHFRKKMIVEELSATTVQSIEVLPPQWLDKVAEIVYENMSRPDFSIELLSELLGISRYTFNRHIKQTVGMTGVQYLQELRLAYARKMLENKKVLSVKACAEMIGIGDTKYFSRLFKNRFGKLPSDYLA